LLLDLSVKVTKESNKNVLNNDEAKLASFGHLGTHFDVSQILDKNIDVSDIDINLVNENMFVAFTQDI